MERKNRAGNTNLEIFDIGMLVEAKGVRKFLQKRGRREKKNQTRDRRGDKESK